MRTLTFLLFAITLFSFSSTAQTDSIQQVIDRQVWEPFMEAYSTFNTDAFMDIHTADVIRIGRDGGRIWLGDEYRQNQEKNNRRSKQEGAARTIEFSFLERIARDSIAYEVGYYKVRSEQPGREPRFFYGHFHVILKKTDGRWKLWIDSDTSHDGTVTEEDFSKGEILR